MTRHDAGQGDSNTSPPHQPYISVVEADSTAKVIIRGAGILALGSALLGCLLTPEPPAAGAGGSWVYLAAAMTAALGALLVFWGPRWLRTTAKVGPAQVTLSTSGIRAHFPLQDIASVTDSYFPSGGYGYRYLGRNHRGFISGGGQVDIKLKDGREYTVSVQSVSVFCSAVGAGGQPG
ncbi:hypothetical protein [Pseudarthrobacter polychromogenes]|uniref:Lipoprotein n=1 Tax=Pseudarthrobacter polychromogenes TaxID=1676 RepID=A0ABQ1XDR6_9MICC|nr:hypothetical protein [Pseudarthrobacter polychromogenes]GGG90435.1 hypothetical protein GCM10011577_11030 [Pseudarthrobacter polychromogenes]